MVWDGVVKVIPVKMCQDCGKRPAEAGFHSCPTCHGGSFHVSGTGWKDNRVDDDPNDMETFIPPHELKMLIGDSDD